MSSKAWGGRFQKSAEAWVDEFGASIGFDQQLVTEDLEGSIAHVTMLGKCGILQADEVDANPRQQNDQLHAWIQKGPGKKGYQGYEHNLHQFTPAQ